MADAGQARVLLGLRSNARLAADSGCGCGARRVPPDGLLLALPI